MVPTKKEQHQLDAIGSVNIDEVQQVITERNSKSDEMLADLMDNVDNIDLSIWDYDFIMDLVNYRENGKNITDRQYEQLLRIYNKNL